MDLSNQALQNDLREFKLHWGFSNTQLLVDTPAYHEHLSKLKGKRCMHSFMYSFIYSSICSTTMCSV